MPNFDPDGVGYDAYVAVMAKREAQLVAMDAAKLETQRELEIAEQARFLEGTNNNLQFGLSFELEDRDFDGDDAPSGVIIDPSFSE